MDVIAVNKLAAAYLDHVFESPGKGNLARFTFLDERARDFFSDWPQVADITTANLRRESARDSKDASVEALIDELTAHSPEFTERWGHRDVRRHGFGRKGVRHHLVGELDLDYESFELTSDPGLMLSTYAAAPGTGSAARLARLANLIGVTPPPSS